MKNGFILVVLAASLWGACKSEPDQEVCIEVPAPTEKVRIKIEQFQDSLTNAPSKQALVALLGREPMIRDYIFRRTEYPNDSVFINELYNRFHNPHFDTLLSETTRVFGDLSGLEAEFSEAFSNFLEYYPDRPLPRIQTVISGLDTDMLVSDSLIVISLDFYLGAGAKYRPRVYDYLLRRYDPNDVVPSCMLVYGIGEINKTDAADKTVVADMVAYGKSFYFAKRMLPCVSDSVFIWYTPEEIRGSRKNQDLIWARFIESQVLFSTSHVVKKDYLGERPITIQVGEKCPGRIGQWVGWQIVNSYMANHPEVTLPQLMETADAQNLFKQSRYKPRK